MTMKPEELVKGSFRYQDDVFDSLKKKKIISASLAGTLRSMKGFRNILVHRYAEVDDEQVFDFLKNNLKDFSAFKKEILKICPFFSKRKV